MDSGVLPSLLRFGKYALANISGGIVSEAILSIGLLLTYGSLMIQGSEYLSPALIGLNVLAQAAGIAFAFFLNERVTLSSPKESLRRGSIGRLLGFEGVNAGGASFGILIQLLLLRTLQLSPARGNIVGALLAIPVTYLI